MKIELNEKSAVSAIIAAIRANKENPTVYVDCNGICYTERPDYHDKITARFWSYSVDMKSYHTLEELSKMDDEELSELIPKHLQWVDLDYSLDKILETENDLYIATLNKIRDLPYRIRNKFERECDFMREVCGDWEECRFNEEECVIYYDHKEIAFMLDNETNLGIYHGKSIYNLFNDNQIKLLEVAESYSHKMYNTVLTCLLEEWEQSVKYDYFHASFAIECGVIYVFTVRRR